MVTESFNYLCGQLQRYHHQKVGWEAMVEENRLELGLLYALVHKVQGELLERE